jgi:di/tricarboxylate transporter
VIKRPNDGSHIRALTLLGITLINSLANLIVLISLLFDAGFNSKIFYLFAGFFLILNIIVDRLENVLYINNNRYKRPIELYSNRFSPFEKRLLGLFAFLLMLGTTIGFIFMGLSFSE